MIGAVKLGIAAGLAYTIGGRAGTSALRMVSPDAAPDALVGAQWAGRIATFIGATYLMGKL